MTEDAPLPPLSDLAREAALSLPWPHRSVLGRLIRRQLNRQRITQELVRYEVDGTMKLCVARALGVYVVLFGIIAVALAAIGLTVACVPFVVLFVLIGLLSVQNAFSAESTGRKWRAK